jgi:GH25 family lysozyme M1 (1,4-beta-N-acetylmuramidase)
VTLYLWDASDYDWSRGPMDLNAAKADGLTGFTHKATEATWIKHNHTGDALNRARNAGIEFIGAYHVVRSTDTAAQVAYFLAYLDQVVPWWRDFPGFFLQIDLEKWPYDAVTASTGIDFANKLVAAQPKWVVMYASRGQYANQLTGCPVPLWNAAYGTNPQLHYPEGYTTWHSSSGPNGGDTSTNWNAYSGLVPVFWQYGSQLRIGSQPGCDANAFRGSVADLRALISGQATIEENDMIMVRIPNGSIYLVPGYQTPSGKMAAFPISSASVAQAYTTAGIATVQLPSLDPVHYELAPQPWPTGGGGGGGGTPVPYTITMTGNVNPQ